MIQAKYMFIFSLLIAFFLIMIKETITINNITEPLEIMLPMLSEEIRTEMIDEELFEYYGLNISETLTSIGDFEEEEGGYPKGIYNYSN